jgi:hypothetical protein
MRACREAPPRLSRSLVTALGVRQLTPRTLLHALTGELTGEGWLGMERASAQARCEELRRNSAPVPATPRVGADRTFLALPHFGNTVR